MEHEYTSVAQGLFTWMFIGNLVMRKMINFKM